MKTLYYALAGLGLIAAGQVSARSTVSGHLSNLRSDTLYVRTISYETNDATIDTVIMKDGNFTVAIDNPQIANVSIIGKPVQEGAEKNTNTRGFSFILLPDSNVEVTGTLTNHKQTGVGFYDELNALNAQTLPYQQKIDSLRSACLEMRKNGASDEEVNAAFEPASDWSSDIIDIKKEYIEANPESNVSVFILNQLPMGDMEWAMETLTEKAKTGVMAPYYNRIRESYEKELARQAAEKAVQPGNPAPDFTLKDLEGKDFTLSSLRGKYVVIDFWGSWCIWCVRGIPEMKKTYEKYKDRIEFVGVDNGDTEEAWKNAVKEHELPWINVINSEDPNVVALYGVRGFPTKFVIDPDGKVAKQVVGEDPEFYKYIDSLIAE